MLASASPRRRELLDLIGLAYRVEPADVVELPLPGETAVAFAERAAVDKARAVNGRGLPVLAADTVVEVDGRILGKPSSDDDALAMLAALSGRSHRVHTGMAFAVGPFCVSLVDTAEVVFSPIPEPVARWYVATGEPHDKAGAYAIQGIGGLFVKAVVGSPHTVVGLPMHRLQELLPRLGFDLWELLEP